MKYFKTILLALALFVGFNSFSQNKKEKQLMEDVQKVKAMMIEKDATIK